MINKCITVKNKTCKEFNSEKNYVNKVNKNQQKIPIFVKTQNIVGKLPLFLNQTTPFLIWLKNII